MHVLVTGAAGRVGSLTVARLLEAGHTVTAFDLRPPTIDDPSLRSVVGSLEDAAALRQACRSADAVIHLAALMSWRPGDADRLFSVNVEGTRNVLDAAAAADAGRFVFASSGEVYPENRPAYLPVDEEHPREPTSLYGLTKLIGEELVHYYGRTAGLQGVILRFSHTQDASELLDPDSFFSGPRFFLGPKIEQQQSLDQTTAVERLRWQDDGSLKLVLSCNEDGRPYRMVITDSRDIVSGVVLGLTHSSAPGNTFNLGADVAVDFEAALERMASETGLPLVRVNLPGDGVFYETSNRKIRDQLGYRPAWTFDDMLDEAVAAWRRRRA